MSEYNFHCDAEQGFNFKKSVQKPIGHVTALKIGTDELEADLKLQDPEDIEGAAKIDTVGVLNYLDWDGGYADPLNLHLQISRKNQQVVTVLTKSELSNVAIEVAFAIYQYDPEAKAYFQAFHTNGSPIIGVLQLNGGVLNISVDDNPGYIVQSPENFSLSLGVVPDKKEEQEIHFAVATDKKMVKKWGIQAS